MLLMMMTAMYGDKTLMAFYCSVGVSHTMDVYIRVVIGRSTLASVSEGIWDSRAL